MGYALRPATPEDAPALIHCIDAAYAGYADQGFDLPLVSSGVADDIRAHSVWVAEEMGQILGGVIVSVGAGTTHLMNVAVHPDHSGKGIGKALIRKAISLSQVAGSREIALTTHKHMATNIALYRHLGWTVTGEAGNKVFMALDLRP